MYTAINIMEIIAGPKKEVSLTQPQYPELFMKVEHRSTFKSFIKVSASNETINTPLPLIFQQL